MESTNKLKVRGTVHDWFKSYLFGRTQQVDYNSSISNIEPISSSVPQGSILGPLLFIIYINDFSKCLKYSNNLSFADDTTIILSAKNNNLLFQKGNKELENIDNWLIANKLSLNVKKTKYILFSSRTTKTLSKDLVLTIRKNQIERVTSVKLLGVIFNEHLTWKDHHGNANQQTKIIAIRSNESKAFSNSRSSTYTFSFTNSESYKVLHYNLVLWTLCVT